MLSRSPHTRLEKSSNALIDRMCAIGEIDWIKKARMKKHNTQLPRIYALPKLHKPDCPLRPVVSTVNSPATELSKYLDSLLRHIVHDKFDVTNSHHAKERLKQTNITRNDTLASLDIVSSFPSIPINFAIDSIMSKSDELRVKSKTKLSKELFKEILQFVLVESPVFCYDNRFYHQIDGTGMGMNVAPVLANIVTNEILDRVLEKLNICPKLIIKYVDDILIIIPTRKFDILVKELNNFLPGKIKFTVEQEENGKIAYLDMLISRKADGKLSVNWYQKPTASNRVLNFLSQHPIQQKRSVVYGFFHRILTLVDAEFRNECTIKIKNVLRANNYPWPIIEKG